MSRGSNLHRTEEGRKKLNFTDKLKDNQDKKKYQKIQNKERNNESSDSGKTKKKSKFIKYKGKMIRRNSPLAKQALKKEASTKALGAKGYMKNKKLKIKK